jgi:hypothetical protein
MSRIAVIGAVLTACCLALAVTAAGASATVTAFPATEFGPLTCGPEQTQITFESGAFRFVTSDSGGATVVHITADQVTASDAAGNQYRLIGAGTDVTAAPGDTSITSLHHSTLIGDDGQRMHVFWYVFHATLTPTGELETVDINASNCS